MKNKISWIIVISIFAIVYSHSYQRRISLSENGLWGHGVIKGWKSIKGTNIVYVFNNKEYVSPTILSGNEIFLLKEKHIPVLYLEKDEETNSLLITKKDFVRYEKSYPDSLKWICDSLNICE